MTPTVTLSCFRDCSKDVGNRSLPSEDDSAVLVDAEGLPGVSCTIRLRLDPDAELPKIGQRLTIDGTMRVRVFDGRLIDGERLEAVKSVEVRGARLIKP